MQATEQYLKKPVVEHTVYKPAFERLTSHPVSVCQEKILTFQTNVQLIAMYLHTQFLLKISESPQIMVPGKIMNGYSPVPHTCQSSQGTGVTTGNHMFVLVPEIKYISHQEKPSRIISKTVQE